MRREPAVTVRVHPREDRIFIRFGHRRFAAVLDAVKALPGRRYHPERAFWSAPDSDAAIRSLQRALGREELWIIDDRPLFGPELPEGWAPPERPTSTHAHPAVTDARDPAWPRTDGTTRRERPSEAHEAPSTRADVLDPVPRNPPDARATSRLDSSGDELLERVRAALELKGYSPRTRKVYLGQLRRFFLWCGGGVSKLPEDPARSAQAYLLELVRGPGISKSYQNQIVSALRFLCEGVLGQPRLALRIPRPKRERKLPAVLSPDEVARLIRRTRNLKHRALLMLLYGAGLRVSEVVRLTPADLDMDRGLVRVRGGKGGKDRYTLLANRAVEAVRLYRDAYPARRWLFPGGMKEAHLTTRSVQRIVQNAAEAAGIEKHVTAHTLRHSFATHLLEGGTNLRVIQELLGHQSARTTQIYTHVARSTLESVPNPLDRLD